MTNNALTNINTITRQILGYMSIRLFIRYISLIACLLSERAGMIEGESFMDQRTRFMSFIEEITASSNEDDEVALFTHGGILISFLKEQG